MNIFLVFPALCLYDKWLLSGSKNCCVNFGWCCRKEEQPPEGEEIQLANGTRQSANDGEGRPQLKGSATNSAAAGDGAIGIGESLKTFAGADVDDEEREEQLRVEHQSLIHRLLDGYYNLLHRFRWLVLAASTAALIACTVLSAQLKLPTSSEVSILPDSNQYQKHYLWTLELLSSEVAKNEGTEAAILWGVSDVDFSLAAFSVDDLTTSSRSYALIGKTCGHWRSPEPRFVDDTRAR